MGIFKVKPDEDWKIKYIKEYNEMQKKYEEKLSVKQKEIESLKNEIKHIQDSKMGLKPKEKQISDLDITNIKKLREEGYSYSLITKETKWSKATISRVLNGFYDDNLI